MANLRRLRPTPFRFEQAPAWQGRRWLLVVGGGAVVLLALAWFDGGEEPLHPIAQDVAVPEQEQ
jgi:hypothetical protein